MPNVVSKEEKEKPELTDKKVANRWIVEGKGKVPHTVRAPGMRELLRWKKLAEESAKKEQKEEKEDK